jgi:radical SAM-linked protein
MVRVFQRACVRADVKVLYSEGFNPRPKLSLPLPRSVGIEADNDLLCLQMKTGAGNLCSLVKTGLSEQLPDGLELQLVRTVKTKTSIQPCRAIYLLMVRREYLDEKLKSRINRLLASENLGLQRQIGTDNSGFKNVDVRPFLESIELGDAGIVVECKISSAGSIRVDEILKLLELDYDILSAPIRRTAVQWEVSES